MTMWDDIQLEPYSDVLKRQVPAVPTEPIPMTKYSSNLPKSCGSPWKGAYSKHGIWYKVVEGREEEFKKIVALSYEQDNYLLSYGDYSYLQKNCDLVYCLVAKNLRGDVMGGVISLIRKKTVHLGMYFVQEDYRHSSIGSQLFGISMMSFEGYQFSFNPMHHLHPSLYKFGLELQLGRKILHYMIDNPTGFTDLVVDKTYKMRNTDGLTASEKRTMAVFLQDVTGQRPSDNYHDENSLTLVVFENGKCVGFGKRTEPAGGDVKRILIAPLYAIGNGIAEAILKELLAEFYHPEEHYDFDPDPLAIYRRQVHLFVPDLNKEVLTLMDKLAGDEKKLSQNRHWHQTASTEMLPGVRTSRIFACSNPDYHIV